MKNTPHKIATLLLLIICLTSKTYAQDLPKFKEGDKICFIGNSITQDGRYHMLFQSFYALRFPGNTIEFYNCGVAGDVAGGMINRFKKDILIHKPNYAFLMTGMNDVNIRLYSDKISTDSLTLAKQQNAITNYYTKTEKLATLLIENNIKPIFITPSIYDQTAKIEKSNNLGANDALIKCSEHIRELAKKHNAPLIDFNTIMKSINEKEQLSDPTFTIVGPDRVHPGDVGHFVMTYEMINTILPSKYVSNIEINAKKAILKKSDNAEVKIHKKSKSLKFDVLQKALPFPVLKRFDKALNFVPFQEEFNNEILKVSHLSKGNYNLEVDGELIDTFSNEELENGINLSKNASTPQYKQAEKVFNLCEKYHKIYGELRTIGFIEYRMLNDYNGPNTVEGKRAFLDKKVEEQKGKSWYNWNLKMCNLYFEKLPKEKNLWNKLENFRTTIYKNNQPKWHKYELKKI